MHQPSPASRHPRGGSPSRRSVVTGLAAGLGLLGSGVLTGCGATDSGSVGAGPELTVWYWPGGLSDRAVRQTAQAFARRATVRTAVLDGDIWQQLLTALTTRTSAPDIAGIKGENLPVALSYADRFLDLNTLGAAQIAGSFAAAKYAQATTADGKQLGLPIDLGPTALFYRADLWGRAGLPTGPTAVAALTATWDGWFEVARRLKKALPNSFAIRSSSDVFSIALAQQPQTFIGRDGTFLGDRGGVKVAWDLAVRSITEGVQAGLYDGKAWNAALVAGTVTAHIGPAWMGLDIESGAPSTRGAWRVAGTPGGPANIGGSYLSLPVTCRDPKLAFEVIRELLSPANQALGFADASLFPAVTAAYTLPELRAQQAFYGGQATIEVFGPAAQALPTVYESPKNAAINAVYAGELANVEGGKDPAKAWQDAIAAGRQVPGVTR